MTSPVRRTSLLCAVALAIALLGLHVCVLPGHVDAAPGHGSSGSHDEGVPTHEGSSEEGDVHAASCEAVRAAPGLTVVVPVVTQVLVFAAPMAMSSVAVTPPASPPGSPPPLFLLHRSLLI
jgi:hypothetical protein